MYQGTTPTIVFKIETEMDMTLIKNAWATIVSSNNKITKTLEELEIDPEYNTVSMSLTQEETLKLPAGSVRVQLRILTADDSAFATPISSLPVEKILEGGVIE